MTDLTVPDSNGDPAAVIEDLRKTIDDLRTAVRARDDFIAIAAHELRNPMTPIASQVELLLAAARRGNNAASMLAGLERLEFFVRHYIRRATTLLDVSRASAGEIPLRPATVDLSGLIRQTAQGYSLLAQRARCRLTLDVPENVLGTWDRLAVEQVLENLISNALKFGAGKPIDISLATDGSGVRLTVRDHGDGISLTDQARIFGRFEQAVGKRQHGGFGVGLWLAHRLVSTMGGEIAVESPTGGGAAFVVRLPWHMAGATEKEQA